MEAREEEIGRLNKLAQTLQSKLDHSENEVSNVKEKLRDREEALHAAVRDFSRFRGEVEWRVQGVLEKDISLERMRSDMQSIRDKLKRSESKRRQVEEALEDALLELSSKKKEMESVMNRIDKLASVFTVA